jgi:superfamily II DNA or RNA helicase
MIELLEHNKKTYKRLCDVLEENNKCALVQATGTGKSYIAGKYIEEHANTTLILVPTNAIADAWEYLLAGTDKKIDIITYQAFTKEPQNHLEYDLVIADEMHHLGSDVWGKKFVETYLQSENHKIIGLTATEVRYLDNSRDMAEEIFENIRVDGCDLPTAINTGVLPTFKYVSALYCDESDFDEWKEKVGKIKDIKTQTELKGKLDVCINNMISVKQAVNENLTNDYKKIIVFLNNVESKETALDMFKDVFPTANFYDVDYSKSRSENNSQIGKFKSDSDRAVLFAVDMLNEGIHVNGTDCIIMFRKTVSPQVYLQQLGRGLASGTDKMPVIFDFVGNINSSISLISQENNDFVGIVNSGISNKEKKIVVKTYLKSIEDCVREINILFKNPFTDDEIEFIKDNYKILGLSKTAEKLGRKKEAVKAKAYEMGISRKTEIKEEDIPNILKSIEENGLRKTASDYGVREMGIYYFLRKKGLYKWHINKYDYIGIQKAVYEGKTNKEILDEFGCSQSYLSSIKKRISQSESGYCNYYTTEEELKIMIDEFNKGTPCTKIGEIIGKHSSTVRRVLREHGYNRTSKEVNSRKIVALTKEGKFVKEFDSIIEGAAFASDGVAKTASSCINQVIRKSGRTAYGYKWLYKEDYEKLIAGQKGGN